MKTIQIDDGTAHKLKMFVASENSGKTYGKIGTTAVKAINQYIDQEEKYIVDLALKALKALGNQKMTRTCTRTELPAKYNESERKLGRSKTAMYMEKGDDWVFILDLLKEEKK